MDSCEANRTEFHAGERTLILDTKVPNKSEFHVGGSTLVLDMIDPMNVMWMASLRSSEHGAEQSPGSSAYRESSVTTTAASELSFNSSHLKDNYNPMHLMNGNSANGWEIIQKEVVGYGDVDLMNGSVANGSGTIQKEVVGHSTKIAGQQHIGDYQYSKDADGKLTCKTHQCGRRYKRIDCLRRHHDNVHDQRYPFICRVHSTCKRAIRGFPRKDKRNEHEWKVHKVNLR